MADPNISNLFSFGNVISLIGTSVSISAAAFSLYQAKIAKRQKTEAEKVKKYIDEKYRNYQNSQLRNEITDALTDLNRLRFQKYEKIVIGAGNNKLQNVSTLAIRIKSEVLYLIPEVKESIDSCLKLIDQLVEENYKSRISEIISCFATVSRYIDSTIRS